MMLSRINRIAGNKKITGLLVPGLIALAILLRLALIPNLNDDLENSYLVWYRYILAHGRFAALKDGFANYTPPYLYLLTLASYLNFLPELVAVKLISIGSDFIAGWLVYKIVALKSQDKVLPWAAFFATLFAPAVFFVSAYWGQVDMLFTVFLLAFIYAMLQNKPFSAMVYFSIAFSFKFQAVFIAPLILILILRKKIPWQYMLLPAPIYVLVMLPAWLAGRKLVDLLLVYFQQAGFYQVLSKNAPNPYIFLPNSIYNWAVPIGSAVAIMAILAFVFYALKSRKESTAHPVGCSETSETWLTEAVIVLSLAPFLLPKMHERYFFPAMVFALVLAFYHARFLSIALLYQATVLISFLPYLKGYPDVTVKIAAIGNLVIIAWLLSIYSIHKLNLPRRIL